MLDNALNDPDDTDGLMVDSRIVHLTPMSKAFLELMTKFPSFQLLKPLADQIQATNKLTRLQAENYRFDIDNELTLMSMYGFFNTAEKAIARNTLRFCLHGFIDGAIDGWRGKLVTEHTRKITTDTGSNRNEKRGWFSR